MNEEIIAASQPTGDPGVDSMVELAAQAGQLPVGDHKELYATVLVGLESELNADPSAALKGVSP
ncbi:hypothetical protein [Arthrobacter sp. N199823]|uniref:hypothetical protein n=1 Tax=Arthrobacter sp. N199823 TaxID=2058895 RepID=UPI000CE4A756|nr:hypothetical protein [Arthrobacter sp. N199823]